MFKIYYRIIRLKNNNEILKLSSYVDYYNMFIKD